MKSVVRPLLALLLSLSAQANAGSIYFFGDSLSDTGNTSAYFANQTPAVIVPNYVAGVTPYAAGQYTDNFGAGVWSQQFAAALGQPNEARFSLAGGHNYSWAGARTYSGAGLLPGLDLQVATYIGAPGVSKSEDLFVIMIGGNDVKPALEAAAMASSPAASGLAIGTAVANGLGNIQAAVNALYADGGRRFLIANMPDVGSTPNVRLSGPAAVAGANAVVDLWNANFRDLILGLNGKAGIDVDVLDMYGLAKISPAYYQSLGFTDLTNTCFVSATTATLQNCSTYFYSDDFHPTSAAHSIIARTALAAVPVPASLALVLVGFIGLFLSRRKAI
jgi:phospholipase/lecithinase/hemolysin